MSICGSVDMFVIQEDTECPLCMDQMDISDMGFKPCPCGYQVCHSGSQSAFPTECSVQICSFCWHHIKENLNGRCPACRRVYTEDAVQFKAMNPEE
jgi:CCR4-NOT transcription complex subunit 4